ncbi:F-box protein [Striga asiatica]|uniref:F-box protein n=1 Tax=Striga asiatica TaxID=4170 RepID=A0A5A7NVU2_STRAF|nr:F-box protein [Striga asiatica]
MTVVPRETNKYNTRDRIETEERQSTSLSLDRRKAAIAQYVTMRGFSATANLLANAKSKFKFLPANLSSTISNRFPITTTAPALSPNLKQHDDNNNKNLMLMVRVLNEKTCDCSVISTENNSFRVVVPDTLPNLSLLRAEHFNYGFRCADYIVRACSNYKWMLLTCQKGPGPSYELLWDPTTDETKPLPLSATGDYKVVKSPPGTIRPQLRPVCWGFGVGFDPRPSGDYKVVRSQNFDFGIRSEVLSLQTDSWKEIPYPYDPEFQPIEKLALHINGFYYWLTRHIFNKNFYAIIPFDFANEEFLPDLIPMPVSEKLGYNVRVVLAEFHGSLAAIVYDFNKPYTKKKKKKPCFEIWVWGNDDWSCVDEFEVPTDCDARHAIIGLYKNDKVLIQDSIGDLLLYDCEDRSLKSLGIHDESFKLRVYPYGKTTVNKGDKLVSLQKNSPQKEKETTELK